MSFCSSDNQEQKWLILDDFHYFLLNINFVQEKIICPPHSRNLRSHSCYSNQPSSSEALLRDPGQVSESLSSLLLGIFGGVVPLVLCQLCPSPGNITLLPSPSVCQGYIMCLTHNITVTSAARTSRSWNCGGREGVRANLTLTVHPKYEAGRAQNLETV